jgi:hypothetical protein
VPVRSDVEIESAINALGREPGGGLVVPPDVFMGAHRASIISATARNKVPTVYYLSDFARDGGLLSYGIDRLDIFRRAASYVDRILRGAKPAELPIQLPTSFELVINLKTAKALGLTIPETLLATADEVIQVTVQEHPPRRDHNGSRNGSFATLAPPAQQQRFEIADSPPRQSGDERLPAFCRSPRGGPYCLCEPRPTSAAGPVWAGAGGRVVAPLSTCPRAAHDRGVRAPPHPDFN